MCTKLVAIVMSTDTPEPEPWPEPDYLMPKSKWSEQKLEIIPGEKKGSEWLIINDEFILNKNRTFKNGNILWECRSRRRYKCPFRMEIETGKESVNILWMFENNIHTCVHDPSVILVHKFKTEVKTMMANNFQAKYSVVYNTTKNKFLDRIEDPHKRCI